MKTCYIDKQLYMSKFLSRIINKSLNRLNVCSVTLIFHKLYSILIQGLQARSLSFSQYNRSRLAFFISLKVLSHILEVSRREMSLSQTVHHYGL